jgi:hypothetical protein
VASFESPEAVSVGSPSVRGSSLPALPVPPRVSEAGGARGATASVGAIVGAVIGGLVLVAVIVFVILAMKQRGWALRHNQSEAYAIEAELQHEGIIGFVTSGQFNLMLDEEAIDNGPDELFQQNVFGEGMQEAQIQ